MPGHTGSSGRLQTASADVGCVKSQALRACVFTWRWLPGGRAAGPIGMICRSRKKPARLVSPAVRPEPLRGKAIGGAEVHTGLLGAGKTGNGSALGWSPAR